MAPSEQTLPESTLSTRLQHFKDACAQQRTLETRIQELIEKGETIAISKVRYAEGELERVRGRAAAVRAEMEEARLICGISTVKSEEKQCIDPSLMNHPLNHPTTQPILPKRASPAFRPAGGVPESNSPSSSRRNSSSLLSGCDDWFPLGTPLYPSGGLEIQSDISATITPTPGVDEEFYNEFLRLVVRRYTEICHARRSLEVEIEAGLEAEELVAVERVVNAMESLKEVREQAGEMIDTLNQAGGGNISKPPSLENVAVGGKERSSEVVTATSSPVPNVVAERANTNHPADEGAKSTNPLSFIAPHKPAESFPEDVIESFRKYDRSLVTFFSNLSPNTIPTHSLFIEFGLRRGISVTPADNSQTFSSKLVEAFAETYWKWKGGDPVCGREIMKTQWVLMRSILSLKKSPCPGRTGAMSQIQTVIDSL